MNAAAREIARVIPVVLPLAYVVERIWVLLPVLAHAEWPNGLRLSGARQRVRCSRGLGLRTVLILDLIERELKTQAGLARETDEFGREPAELRSHVPIADAKVEPSG